MQLRLQKLNTVVFDNVQFEEKKSRSQSQALIKHPGKFIERQLNRTFLAGLICWTVSKTCPEKAQFWNPGNTEG